VLPQAFQADQTAWTIQPMLGFVRSLRSVAEAADTEAAAGGRRPEKLADCLDKLRKLFQAAQQAAGECARFSEENTSNKRTPSSHMAGITSSHMAGISAARGRTSVRSRPGQREAGRHTFSMLLATCSIDLSEG